MVKIKATARSLKDFQLIVDNGRGHKIICDLPKSEGGRNEGPSALELAVMSLAACTVTTFTEVCKQSKIELGELEVEAEAGKQSGSPRLTEVNIRATVSAKARKQLLEAVWRRTEANCPVLLIYQDHVPTRVRFEVIQR